MAYYAGNGWSMKQMQAAEYLEMQQNNHLRFHNCNFGLYINIDYALYISQIADNDHITYLKTCAKGNELSSREMFSWKTSE